MSSNTIMCVHVHDFALCMVNRRQGATSASEQGQATLGWMKRAKRIGESKGQVLQDELSKA